MEKAKALLMDERKTVYTIALEMGYNDPRYFSRLFKTIVGKTPSEYRNSVLVNQQKTDEKNFFEYLQY